MRSSTVSAQAQDIENAAARKGIENGIHGVRNNKSEPFAALEKTVLQARGDLAIIAANPAAVKGVAHGGFDLGAYGGASAKAADESDRQGRRPGIFRGLVQDLDLIAVTDARQDERYDCTPPFNLYQIRGPRRSRAIGFDKFGHVIWVTLRDANDSV
jgi:hypothetical protein